MSITPLVLFPARPKGASQRIQSGVAVLEKGTTAIPCGLRLDLNPLGCSAFVIITWKEYNGIECHGCGERFVELWTSFGRSEAPTIERLTSPHHYTPSIANWFWGALPVVGSWISAGW